MPRKEGLSIIGGGAAIGTAIGAITGGKRGAAIGAIAGGSGTGLVLATKGKQLSYPSETLMIQARRAANGDQRVVGL